MAIPNRIAFGSCNEQDLQNNMWPIIEQRNPAAFIWGGDAIYGGKAIAVCTTEVRGHSIKRTKKLTHSVPVPRT
jgi:hypothetical protein